MLKLKTIHHTQTEHDQTNTFYPKRMFLKESKENMTVYVRKAYKNMAEDRNEKKNSPLMFYTPKGRSVDIFQVPFLI
jgi:hypothetical protein